MMGQRNSQSKPERPERETAEFEQRQTAARLQASAKSSVSDSSLPTLNDFGKSVVRSHLVDAQKLKEQAAQFQEQSSTEERTSRKFAKYLVESGVLTRYQAERLLAGRSEGFYLGECTILDRLGAGGMGKVYLAEQVKLGRQVALKVLPAKFAQDADYLARFQREARAAAGLKHANIVQVYDVGEDRGTHYIIMELVRGANLSERLKEIGPMPFEESIDIIRQVAAGLQHAHEHGIVHRDIKPSNLVLEGKTVKILDLGLARQFDSGDTITQEMRSMGTPDYMSPEQVQDAHSADIRSDLYSLGCTWYTLLTGRPPFPGGDAVSKAMAHMQKSPEPVQKLAADVPDGVSATIDRLMAKDREDRYQTPAELLEALKDWRSETLNETIVVESGAITPVRAGAVTQTPAPVADDEDADAPSLIQAPSTGVPTFLLYLVPVMAALILGGAYFGIQALRDQVSGAEPLIVEVPAATSNGSMSTPDGQRDQQSNNDQNTSTASPGTPETKTNVGKTANSQDGEEAKPNPTSNPDDNVANVDPQSPVDPETKAQPPARQPQTWRIGEDGDAAGLSGVWDKLISGDQLQIATSQPLEVPPLEQGERHLVITADADARPILLMQLPAVPQNGHGLWKINGGSLTLTGVDLYIDLTERKVADPEVVVFELNESDLHLVDTSITVLRGRVEGRSPVTAVKLLGERPWDKTAKGNAPQPTRLEVRNAMLRGVEKVAFVDSRQASLRFENSVVASPGTLLHLFHTRPLEYAHHAMQVEVANCTLDTSGPLATIDTRPYELRPVKTELTVRSSLICSGTISATDMPPQVLWQSPASDEVLTTSLKWFGQDNCYVNRADCFKTKTAAGPILTLVQTPGDWARQNFGQAVDWFAPPAKSIKLPREAWDDRLPNDYPHPTFIARLRRGAGGSEVRVGADPKDMAVPRRYRK